MKDIVLSLISKSNTNNLKFSKTNNKKTVLLIVCSADRGLCGGFNGSIIKYTKHLANTLKNDGKNFKFFFVGKKAYQSLRRVYKDLIIDLVSDFANPRIEFDVARSIRDQVLKLFFDNEISECYLIYTKFNSAISQNVESQKLLPVEKDHQAENLTEPIMYDFEPDEEVILDDIIPKNIAIQIHSALLENLASEQGSRMTAMDNATRNANDMIDKLTLFYNRSRQALITKELIEIISGAEAV